MSYNKLTRDWELPSFQETRNRWANIAAWQRHSYPASRWDALELHEVHHPDEEDGVLEAPAADNTLSGALRRGVLLLPGPELHGGDVLQGHRLLWVLTQAPAELVYSESIFSLNAWDVCNFL